MDIFNIMLLLMQVEHYDLTAWTFNIAFIILVLAIIMFALKIKDRFSE